MAIACAVLLAVALTAATEGSAEIADDVMLVQRWTGGSQPTQDDAWAGDSRPTQDGAADQAADEALDEAANGTADAAANGMANGTEGGIPVLVPAVIPIPVKVKITAPTKAPYNGTRTRFWSPHFDGRGGPNSSWSGPNSEPMIKERCYTDSGRHVHSVCVTADWKWYSVEDDWPVKACDDHTCRMRCDEHGQLFRSDLGESYGPGMLRECHQRFVLECEHIRNEHECNESLAKYGLECTGWAGAHCMPMAGAKCTDITDEQDCTTGAFAHMGCVWSQKGCNLPA